MAEVPIMVMPWHRPDPCKPLTNQTNAAFKSSYLDYMTALSLDSRPLPISLTKIMCTIGPSSNKVDTMVDLMQQGMTMGLVPLGLGVRQDHVNTIANLRFANTAYSNTKDRVFPLSIALQTKGPGIRIGGLKKDMPIDLPLQHTLTLTTDKAWRTMGTEHILYIGFPEMCEVLDEGDILLLGAGIVILQVQSMDKSEVVCKVVGGGVVHSFMSVSLPDVPLRLPPLTDEDVDDLKLAALMKVDIVVATRTQSASLLKDIRNILEKEEHGSGIQVWAQIESKQGLDNLESILEVADAVLLSRVSLTQDMSPNKLFLAQKLVIGSCNKAGIPVFLSAHFLPSMQMEDDPSVAELSDVSAAILDGADGFVLRKTTSVGKHPQRTVKILSEICREAEAAVWHYQTFSFLNSRSPPPVDPTHAIAISAVEASLKASAAAILLATTSGRSAELVARYRPRCPIIAISRYGQVARKLNTRRAIIPLQYTDPPLPDWSREVDVRLQLGLEYAKEQGIVVPGDCLVLLNGWRLGAGFTNTIRVVYASDSFPWVYPHHLPSSVPSDQQLKDSEEPSSDQEDNEPGSKRGWKKQGGVKNDAFGDSSYPTLDQNNWDAKNSNLKSRNSRVSFHDIEKMPLSGSVAKSMKEEFKLIAANSSIEIQKQNLQEVVSKHKSSLEKQNPPNSYVNQPKLSIAGSEGSSRKPLLRTSGPVVTNDGSQKSKQSQELEVQQ